MTQHAERPVTPVTRTLVVGYGAAAYLLFLGAFLYTIGFVGNVAVPKGIDDGATGPVALAIVVNSALLGLFAVQHSVMARPWFKRWWTRFVPPSAERSTFVLAATLVLILLLWQWRPMPGTIWSVEAGWAVALLWALYAAGWLLVLGSTFAIDHFDLFGLRQVAARARSLAYDGPGFRQPWPYRLVRHPLMVGFIVAFWAAPEMSAGRLLFAALGTAYIVVAVRFEERDLRRAHGEDYERYTARVPRFVPRVVPRRAGAGRR
jgi:methanethiol S-methyltransferase